MDVLPGRDDHVFTTVGLVQRAVQRTTNFELVRALVARGFGYLVLVQRPIHDVTYDGLPFVTRAIANPISPLRVVMGWLTGLRLHRRVAAFVDFSTRLFGEGAGHRA
jgi:DNA-binding transcriptional LysR family regulator